MEKYLCNVVFAELPEDVYSLSTKTEDGKYIILLNCYLSKEEFDQCLLMEFEHVRNGDHENRNYPSVYVEIESHKGNQR